MLSSDAEGSKYFVRSVIQFVCENHCLEDYNLYLCFLYLPFDSSSYFHFRINLKTHFDLQVSAVFEKESSSWFSQQRQEKASP